MWRSWLVIIARENRKENTMTQQYIENHPTYKKVLADSFGGVMYDVANQGKYDAKDIIEAWDRMTESQRSVAGGIMKGAIEFLKGE